MKSFGMISDSESNLFYISRMKIKREKVAHVL
jgi:hypothetical protein